MTAVDFFKPFIESSILSLREKIFFDLEKKNIYSKPEVSLKEGTCILFPFRGVVDASIYIHFSRAYTMRLSSRYISDKDVLGMSQDQYQDFLTVALKNLAQQIIYPYIQFISDSDIKITSKEPIIYIGNYTIDIKNINNIFIIDLTSVFGDISIYLSFTNNQGGTSHV